MAVVKRILCLANSDRPGGRCVAGKELATQAWVRPVSSRESQSLQPRERQFENGAEPMLGDVLDIGLISQIPSEHQPENWVIDAARRWQWVDRTITNALEPYVDAPASLWTNGSSAADGLNDRIAASTLVPQSLYFVRVPTLVLDSHIDPVKGRKRLSGEFELSGVAYRLSVTDPTMRAQYARRGRYDLGSCYLTVSLTEPFLGNCYKLIAGVLTVGTR